MMSVFQTNAITIMVKTESSMDHTCSSMRRESLAITNAVEDTDSVTEKRLPGGRAIRSGLFSHSENSMVDYGLMAFTSPSSTSRSGRP
jgi:hypothetical protein